MIEIEKKFILTPKQKDLLLKDAEFISKKEINDVYYDTAFYSLAQKDEWLRSRNGKMELKIGIDPEIGKMNQYKEIENDQEIYEHLNLKQSTHLEEDLKDQGFIPIISYKTVRNKYKKEGFTIDVDITQFPEGKYEIVEIELLVNDKSETEKAVQKIKEFALKHDLDLTPVRGKIAEYAHRHIPELNEIIKQFKFE